MYYSHQYVTKWHDTDGDGVMRPSALLVYMQETANLQCREYGMDLNDLHHIEGKGFLLSRIMIKVFSPLHAYEDIEVRTWCIDNKSYDFIRCFAVYRGDEMMALAVSHWALLDIHEKKMIRTTDFRRDFRLRKRGLQQQIFRLFQTEQAVSIVGIEANCGKCARRWRRPRGGRCSRCGGRQFHRAGCRAGAGRQPHP